MDYIHWCMYTSILLSIAFLSTRDALEHVVGVSRLCWCAFACKYVLLYRLVSKVLIERLLNIWVCSLCSLSSIDCLK